MNKTIAQLRAQNPVILTIANMVTPGDVANAVNAVGGSPIMSSSADEAGDMVGIANAVAVNAGTLTAEQRTQIKAVLGETDKSKCPVVLDPVAVALPTRHRFIEEMLTKHRISLIRGNAGEIASLAGIPWNSHGVDSGSGDNNQLVNIAQQCARKYNCLVALTGPQDIVTDGNDFLINDYGTQLFQAYVGCGDMLSSVLAAFLAANGISVGTVFAGIRVFTIAGQLAACQLDRPLPGSFFVKLLDELATITDDDVQHFINHN